MIMSEANNAGNEDYESHEGSWFDSIWSVQRRGRDDRFETQTGLQSETSVKDSASAPNGKVQGDGQLICL